MPKRIIKTAYNPNFSRQRTRKTRIYTIKARRLLLGLLILAVVGVAVYYSAGPLKDAFLKWQYPVKYSDSVEKYAQSNGLDPYLVYAMIQVESGFNPSATSRNNAKGLMQLMDDTAAECAKEIGDGQSSLNPYDPDTSIKLGTWYMKKLLDDFGQTDLALAAYNAGSGNVRKWMNDPNFSDFNGNLTDIPFLETKNYLKKVQNAYAMYTELYEGKD